MKIIDQKSKNWRFIDQKSKNWHLIYIWKFWYGINRETDKCELLTLELYLPLNSFNSLSSRLWTWTLQYFVLDITLIGVKICDLHDLTRNKPTWSVSSFLIGCETKPMKWIRGHQSQSFKLCLPNNWYKEHQTMSILWWI